MASGKELGSLTDECEQQSDEIGAEDSDEDGDHSDERQVQARLVMEEYQGEARDDDEQGDVDETTEDPAEDRHHLIIVIHFASLTRTMPSWATVASNWPEREKMRP